MKTGFGENRKVARLEVRHHLVRNIALLIGSFLLAILLVKAGFLNLLLSRAGGVLFGSFVAGFFFTSVVTIGPATVMLVSLTHAQDILAIALIGALGSVAGDLILFYFVRDRISDDFLALLGHKRSIRWKHILKSPTFHWLTPVIGAIVIASPLPDELGLAMMGIVKVPTSVFIPLSYAMNFIGIFLLGLITKGF